MPDPASPKTARFCCRIRGYFAMARTYPTPAIASARIAQGIFDPDGLVRGEYTLQQAYLPCAAWANAADCGHVMDSQFPNGMRELQPEDALSAVLVGVIELPGAGVPVNKVWSSRIGTVIAGSTIGIAAGVTLNALIQSVSACYQQTPIGQITSKLPYSNPCDVAPTFSPGTDVREAAEHKIDAIAAKPTTAMLTYLPNAEQTLPRRWYRNTSPCDPAGVAAERAARPGVELACDEYPYYSSTTAGPPGASLRLIDAADNGLKGTKLRSFTLACPTVGAAAPVDRQPYLVAPQLAVPTAAVADLSDRKRNLLTRDAPKGTMLFGTSPVQGWDIRPGRATPEDARTAI